MTTWQKKPGECYDKNGVPIYPGDLLKSYHFTGARRKKYWLYHLATIRDGAMWIVNVHNLATTNFILDGGGNLFLTDEWAEKFEIISGYGPKGCVDFEDRPKLTKAKGAA